MSWQCGRRLSPIADFASAFENASKTTADDTPRRCHVSFIESNATSRRRRRSQSVVTHTAQRRGVVTALALIAFFVAWTVREFQPPDDMPIAAASPPRPRVRTIVASGTLQPVTTVQVGAQVSGTVQSLRADYNSIVHAGEVIAGAVAVRSRAPGGAGRAGPGAGG